jgi:AraC-like DNA-binding protein
VDTFYLRLCSSLKAQNAGLFISKGTAMHPTRTIQSHELIFVKQGELEMWEASSIFRVEAGETLHLWPGRRHGSTKPMPPDLKFYWIHFEVEDHHRHDEWETRENCASIIEMPQVCRVPQPERLERLFRMFLDDQEMSVLNPTAANLLTMLMLLEVAKPTEEKAADPNDTNIVATWAHTYIRLNYDRQITTSKVAQALGYNPDYLGRIYRKMYGCTLTEAIHRRRVNMACEFLLDSNMTIEQIAQKCGFTDPDYFRRVFRHYMQITPGDYRLEYSHIHVNTH